VHVYSVDTVATTVVHKRAPRIIVVCADRWSYTYAQTAIHSYPIDITILVLTTHGELPTVFLGATLWEIVAAETKSLDSLRLQMLQAVEVWPEQQVGAKSNGCR
jgi:hypothetical protein